MSESYLFFLTVKEALLQLSFLLLLFHFITNLELFRQGLHISSPYQGKAIITISCGLLAILGFVSTYNLGGVYLNLGLTGVVAATLAGGFAQGVIVTIILGFVSFFRDYRLYSVYMITSALLVTFFLESATARLLTKKERFWPVGIILGFGVTVIQSLALFIAYPSRFLLLRSGYGLVFLVNTLMMLVLMYMLDRITESSNDLEFLHTKRTLSIVDKTLPYLRTGLNVESAGRTAQIILEITDVEAVAITDRQNILAFEGIGADHHFIGETILTKSTKNVLDKGEPQVLLTRNDIGCPLPDCPLSSAVVAPLSVRDEVVGTVKFYVAEQPLMTDSQIDLAIRLARLLSIQMELSEVENLEKLKTQAELKALKAQINPHFLFNTLNTIASFSRTKPEEARKLLIQFSDLFRKTLQQHDDYIPLAEELEMVENYLVFEKARLGERLEVRKHIDNDTLGIMMPPLILQPIIENAIQHGISKVSHKGIVIIRSRIREKTLHLVVRDNGKGIPYENISKVLSPGYTSNVSEGTGFGLYAVSERIKTIYGQGYGVEISSIPDTQTEVVLKIPISMEDIFEE